jgi:hypothetical protein
LRDEPGREVDLPGAMLHQERSGSTEGATCCSGWRRRTRWFVRTGAGAPKVRLEEFESRIRALEGWRAEKAGEERRLSTMSAGAGGVVGGVVAVLVKVLGGG